MRVRAVTAAISQNQFDALVSFAYNVGAGAFSTSTLVRMINAGNTVEAARHLALASADIIIAVLSGRKPDGLLNPEVWERRHH